MKYAYPQDPTHAVSAIRRYDESSDSSTSQSSLERQQDIAVVGETVPLIFCHRFDWGGELGTNGGVWISPRLIQLGIETTNLSMMYLLSQGKVDGLKVDNTYWGYQKLQTRDPSAQMCYAYEAVPACLDLDYDPGGSLSWTTTQTNPGPNLNSNGGTFNTAENCIKLVVTFNSVIEVTNSWQAVGGFDGYYVIGNGTSYGVWYDYDSVPNTSGGGDPDVYYNSWETWTNKKITGGTTDDFYSHRNPQAPSSCRIFQRTGGSSWARNQEDQSAIYRLYNNHLRGNGKYKAPYAQNTYYTYVWFADFREKHLQASFLQTSEVRYDWRVRNVADNLVVKSGQVWVKHGTQSLTIDDLPAGQYVLEFDSLYKERDAPINQTNLNSAGNFLELENEWYRACDAYSAGSGAGSGFQRHTNVGRETQQIQTTITQTLYNQIDFPDLPGGDQQIVGGLSDLTMMGIAGDITVLRPQDGPDYFLQSHIFVEQGIDVERLTWGGTGSSPFYGDLVNYLFEQSKILQDDQIDRDSLILANRVNEKYKLYFNGVLQTTNSLAEWMTRTAPYFLMTPRQVDGKYGLWPVCPVDGNNELSRAQTVPVITVTRDDIVQGSYSRTYISPKDRRPVCLVMVYRDQPETTVGQTVTVEVRYPGTALSGPFESHDLTEFCCRSEQAVYAARYILSKRRYTTHTVSFTMARRAAQLKPGDVIKVDLAFETTDGQGITDAIFYQIESLSEGQAGSVNIEATHFPTETLDGVSDVSVVAYETHKGNVSIQ